MTELRWIICAILVLGLERATAVSIMNSCDRDLGGGSLPRRPGDNGYRVRVIRQPEHFTAGEVYQVLLQSTPPLSFKEFVLVAVDDDDQPYGELSILDTRQSMMAEDCPHGATHVSSVSSKTSVTFQWEAPAETDGRCVTFKASVMQRKVWFMDDGNLSVRLCQGEAPTEAPAPECCACSVAEYDFSFYGLWTEETHPRDYPSGRGNHWSDIIGATHSGQYLMWEDGGYATEGVKRLAQWGSPVTLEKEMRLQGSSIRSVFKHRGLWPAVGNMSGMLMEVDRQRHMVSALTMIGPSPDWLVGISNADLCTSDCGWVESAEYAMLPWDAGTDSGISYMSRNAPTVPAERIHRLTQSFPNNEENPFYDPEQGEVLPLGKIVVTRLSVTEAPCDTVYEDTDTHEEEQPEQPSGPMMKKPGMVTEMPQKEMATGRYVVDCMMSEWSDWGECSKSCGKGRMVQTRMIKVKAKNGGESCGPRKQSKKCMMEVCSRDCMMRPWGDWRECSVTCGEGVQIRMRKIKKHSKGSGEPCGDLKEMRVCEMPAC